eukprot:CAMPEP_0176100954 /NCGR_PEP_ID=MMETSP0120_2-20121206/50636_1 /TAXON_ID=160619 /ORGANISM="Kryptoperidinium foliaceum, Strain CCMP 1326" /LENGTH=286 /DNA_ID=CAMNT_0017435005 /DNA_START=36 /DNA_END=894 /DNA_ORIENTATION=-
MGRFQCVNCSRCYYDKRFIWESDVDVDAKDDSETTKGYCSSESTHDSDTGSSDGGSSSVKQDGEGGEASITSFPSETSPCVSSSADEGKAAGTMHSDSVDEQTNIEFNRWFDSSTTVWMSSSDERGSNDEEEVTATVTGRTVADTMRAFGTTANIVGTLIQEASMVCSPISVLGGTIGLVGGATQLYQGLATASGNVDPHLVTKGGITASVGGTCMILGACAVAAPPLFAVALGLGVTGLGAATLVDSIMHGLCPECRGESTAGAETPGVSDKAAPLRDFAASLAS